MTEKTITRAEQLHDELEASKNEKTEKFDKDLYKPYRLKQAAAVAGVGAGAVLILSGIIGLIISAVLKGSALVYTILVSVLALDGIFTVLGIGLLKKCNTKIAELNKLETAADEREEARRDNVLDVKNNLKLLLMHSEVKSLEELRNLYNIRLGLEERIKSLNKAKIGFLEGETYEELEKSSENAYDSIETPDEISDRLDEMRNRQMKLIYDINSLRSKAEKEITRLP